MLSCFVSFSCFNDLVLLFFTSWENVFMDRICLSSHSTLVSSDIIGFNQITICGNFHTFINYNKISHKQIILVKLCQLSTPNNCCSFPTICNTIELNKLSLFLVIISSCYCSTYHNSHQYCKPFNPCCLSFIRFSSSN